VNPEYEIRYLKTAECDLYGIVDYISQDNPSAAAALLKRIGTLLACPLSSCQGLDMSPVPHGHPKNDATTCGKPAHVTHSTQDGRNNERQDEKEPESVHPETR